jgi:hypothetical protein
LRATGAAGHLAIKLFGILPGLLQGDIAISTERDPPILAVDMPLHDEGLVPRPDPDAEAAQIGAPI